MVGSIRGEKGAYSRNVAKVKSPGVRNRLVVEVRDDENLRRISRL